MHLSPRYRISDEHNLITLSYLIIQSSAYCSHTSQTLCHIHSKMLPTTRLILGSSASFLLIVLLSPLLQILPQQWLSTPLQYLHLPPSYLPSPTPTTHILSSSPLLLSVTSFLSPHEISHLLHLGHPLFTRSLIKNGTVSPSRTSESCFLPGKDTIVSRIKTRAEQFMGGMAYDSLEAVQLVRYAPGQKVNLHYDWSRENKVDRQGREWNRVASFFVYLVDACEGGETWFPNVTVAEGIVEEGVRNMGGGISVSPKAGSGLFWVNLKEDGTGDRRTLHAGLPVGEGMKVGMNIWVKKLL